MKKVFVLLIFLIILQINNKKTESVFLDIDSNMDYYVVDVSNLNITDKNLMSNILDLQLIAVNFYINPVYSEKVDNYFYNINDLNDLNILATRHLEKIKKHSINDYNNSYLNGVKVKEIVVVTDNPNFIARNFRNSSYGLYRNKVF